ncbi:MAG: hypothetical protein JWP09_715 [Candidatus Taylorbacteria bacterium]|nr:hypothetical protein [Candidatus Taylorbacteria bacterium]
MQELFEKLKKPMIIVAVIIGGFIVYNTFVKQDTSTALLKTSNVANPTSPEEDLLPLLLKIQNVTLDEKLFLDPVFRALVDRSQAIVPESVGKSNPFDGTITSDVVSNVEGLGFVDETATTTPQGTPTPALQKITPKKTTVVPPTTAKPAAKK